MIAKIKLHYFIILFFLSILIISLNATPPPRCCLFVPTSFSLQDVQVPSRSREAITVGVSSTGYYYYQSQRQCYVWIDKTRNIKRSRPLLVPRSTTVLGIVPWKKGQHNNHNDDSEETDNHNKDEESSTNNEMNDIDLKKGNSPVPPSSLTQRANQKRNKRRPLLFVRRAVRNVLSRVPFSRPRRKTHTNGGVGSMVYFSIDTEPNVIYEHFMKLALEQARIAFTKGEVPIGAIVVQRVASSQMERGRELTTICFQILSCAYNRVETLKDPTAQAELLALQNAAQYCDNWRLSGNNNNTETTLYTTLEPCAMCVSSCQAFRVNHVVYGFSDSNAGAVESFSKSSSPPHPYHPHMTITKFELSPLLENENVTIMQENMTRNSTNKTDTTPITTSKTSPAIKNAATNNDNDDLSLFQLLDNDPDILRTMNELQMAEQNLFDAEQELTKLIEFSPDETTITKDEKQDQSFKVDDASPPPLGSFGRLANLRRTLFPKRQQTKKKKFTMPSDQAKVKEEEPLDTTREEEDLMSNIILTPKQILETHVTENALEEMKRVQQASLEKTEDDVLRILNDIEHIKQIFQPTTIEDDSSIISEGSDEPPNTTKKVEEETPPTILRIWKRKG